MIFSKKIKHFMKLIEEGSYTKASEALFLTASALRHSIYELERKVASKLFYRENGGIALTDNGRVLYESLYPIYNKANRIYNEFIQGRNVDGVLRIFIDGLYYPKIVNEIEYIYSEIKREVTISQIPNSSLQELLTGRCDIAIGTTTRGVIAVPENISDITLSIEKLGFLVGKKTFQKYLSLHELCHCEKMFVRGTMLHHPVLEHVCNCMKIHDLNYSLMGLPDISDVSTILSSGNGFTLASADILTDKLFNKNDFEFIPNPFSEPLFIERHMFFDSGYNPNFRFYADILKT
ncbi:HTH-type transcriptional regulator AbgR [Serratia quinivorans]|uniref:LysR family transcriptional regulator n=1 Tax=Serratia quinivorans TaxID=137545 RepID=UPI00217B50CE|nr:LysR family transcriptional regulator [Serratia quinivorans]CAI2001372.1 HTH-type transcriptional regulator AbgR [Serratia quinivorans]